ncbi:hypothetical protein GCM10010430_13810 [Kitasatospora cystarginea]|uniref:HTH cro/C1-type domain-containing protein n=1 Tax=Kitasatospora cystarginea TaxID=58350 RepID=A0ABN3DKF3_9ACTN
MSRRPRPLDPNDGPLQAFAYELRCLRQEAGNPTYRALAATAGFSATTLSDAAGGMRKPTLEVTLAYVGACRGDVKLWEKRWYALDRRLAGTAGADAQVRPSARDQPDARVQPSRVQGPRIVSAVIGPTEASAEERGPVVDALPEHGFGPEPVDGEESSAPRPRWWWPRAWLPALGFALVLGLTGLLVVWQRAAGGTDTDAVSGCPASPAGGTTFHGTTYAGDTRVRSGATRGASVIGDIPPGCKVHFVGFCIGDVVMDYTGGTPDARWFELSGGGMVSSATVHGNPPAGSKPDVCPGGLPAPASISLTVSQHPTDPDGLDLHATGSYLGIVGFAAYFSDSGQAVPAPRWHQLGLTDVGPEGFTVPWHLAKRTADQGPIRLAAVACLGGDGPTDVVDALALPPAAVPTQARPVPLGEGERSAAAQTACRYPTK